MKLWLGEVSVQKTLKSYAGGYKQALANAKDPSGRAQMSLDSARDITADMFSKSIPEALKLDIGFFDGGRAFMDSIWVYGFLPYPNMAHIGFAPNNAACIRIQAIGEVRALMIDTIPLVKVTRETVGPAMDNLDFPTGMLKWDLAVHKQCDVLFMPQGWLLVEVTVVGCNLAHGVRKSFMVGGAVTTSAYETVLQLCRSSGRNISRMEDILTKMKATV